MSNKNKVFKFLTDQVAYEQIETKSGKEHYVTGYISVPEVDIYNDLVTPVALKSMLNQIHNSTIMLDYEHEAWRDNQTLIPVGKIVDAKIDDRGLWVKAVLNKSSPKFKDMWGSIKGGFVKAFSIAFKALSTVTKSINGTQVRVINDLQLLNVALTGTPVNLSATMTDYGMKAVMLKAISEHENNEVVNMPEEEKAPEAEAPKEEAKEEPKAEAPAEPEQKAEEDKKEEEEKKALAKKEEEKKAEEEEAMKKKESVENKAVEDLTAELKALHKTVEAQGKELKSLKDTGVFKSKTPEQPEIKSEEPNVSVLGMIK